MNDETVAAISDWVVRQGIAGTSENELLNGFCERALAAGLALSRGLVLIDTLHPTFEGRAFRWRHEGAETTPWLEYGRSNEGEAADRWRRTTFFHMLQSEVDELSLRLQTQPPPDFYGLDELIAEGTTHCLVLLHRLAEEAVIGEMDSIYTHWSTCRPDGFGEAEMAALRRLVPPLALAMKSASLARIAGTLAEVYLGRDAGRRVLKGRIQRGVAEKIGAVLWFSDLHHYTIADGSAPDEVIPFLNDYAEAVISAIHAAGGDVLKLMGDGTLAIFAADDPGRACRCALEAEALLERQLAALNARRGDEGRPVTHVYLGLHIGDVFYGNIGSEERLDFTVVGPAVNEVSRIASMCRSVDQRILMSAAFAAATPQPERAALVSIGRYALRGVGRPQELFTLDPTAWGPTPPRSRSGGG